MALNILNRNQRFGPSLETFNPLDVAVDLGLAAGTAWDSYNEGQMLRNNADSYNAQATSGNSWGDIFNSNYYRNVADEAVHDKMIDYSNERNNFNLYNVYSNEDLQSDVNAPSSKQQWGNIGSSILKDTATGAKIGAMVPGLGPIVAPVVGAISGLTRGIVSNIQNNRNADELNRITERANQVQLNNFAQTAQNNTSIANRNAMRNRIYAFGGGIENENGVNKFNVGDTHSKNPLGGIPQGITPTGQPNLVEEGEVKFNDYIFSNRLKISKKYLKDVNLPERYAGKSYAEVATILQKESQDRPNDPISKTTKEDLLGKLQIAQETYKFDREQKELAKLFDNLSNSEKAQLASSLMTTEQPEMFATGGRKKNVTDDYVIRPRERNTYGNYPFDGYTGQRMGDEFRKQLYVNNIRNQYPGNWSYSPNTASTINPALANYMFGIYPSGKYLDPTKTQTKPTENLQSVDVTAHSDFEFPQPNINDLIEQTYSKTNPVSSLNINLPVEQSTPVEHYEHIGESQVQKPFVAQNQPETIDPFFVYNFLEKIDRTPIEEVTPTQQNATTLRPVTVRTNKLTTPEPVLRNPAKPIKSVVPESHSELDTNKQTIKQQPQGLNFNARHAAELGSLLGALGSTFAPVDYRLGRDFRSNVRGLQPVAAPLMGGYQQYNFLDSNISNNQAISANAAALRANRANANKATQNAQAVALNNALQLGLANNRLAYQQANAQSKLNTDTYNSKIDQANLAAISSYDQLNNKTRAARIDQLNAAAKADDAARSAWSDAFSENWTSLFENLGELGKEDFYAKQLQMYLDAQKQTETDTYNSKIDQANLDAQKQTE